LLVEPLRRDLHISDTQVSQLQGLSFALFYACFGLPLGHLADLRSRRSIIAAGLVAWSFFTSSCGLARNFVQMFLFRTGVGVGEAALSPSAYSMITDYFPETLRATALSVYSMAIYIGGGAAFVLGGVVVKLASTKDAWIMPLLGAIRPWQIIFLIVGLPGLLLALLVFTVQEPIRRGLVANAPKVPMKEVLTYIRSNKTTFLCHHTGLGMLSVAAYAAAAWIPEMFRRDFHWDIPTTGLYYGIIVAVGGSAGIVSAGRIADWLRVRDVLNANMRVGIYIALLSIPVTFGVCLAPNGNWALLWLVPGCMLMAAPYGIAAAAIQQVMPTSMRGRASALYLAVNSLIGLGIGPTAVALCTQYLFRRDEAVNYSLLLVSVVAFMAAALLLWIGSKAFLGSLDRLREWNEANSEERLETVA